MNGTGLSEKYGLLKAELAKTGPCRAEYPHSAELRNTFMKISKVTGSCGHVLVGDKSVATYPSPNDGGKFNCGDSILLSTSGNTNKAVKQAEDYCPGCYMYYNKEKEKGHMDDYSASPACVKLGDYGNYWTANTHGEEK